MRFPIGCSDFNELVDKQLDFVDKTLFIKEVFDNPGVKVSIITRPRRLGKTLNLSMLHCFLTSKVYGQPTGHLFKGLKISQYGDAYLQHQGRYPVIAISLKDVKGRDFNTTYANLCFVVARLYQEYYYLLSSLQLAENEKKVFSSILEKNAEPTNIRNSLADLSRYLFNHHGVKPWILIDEYDSPIQAGYLHGFYEQIIQVMQGLFGSALKDNHYMDRAIVTGSLCVSKESLFSDIDAVLY